MTVVVALKQVAEINPNTSTSSMEPSEEVDFFPMAVVDARNSIVTAAEQRPLEQVSKGFTSFANGDVLLAKITPCFENGKIAQATVQGRIAFGSTEFHTVRCGPTLDGRYLTHFLRRPEVRIDGQRKMTGSGGQRRVPKHFLESLQIPLPDLVEQRRIAAILDKADALRAKRREAFAQLDRLAQSIFMEMFGDPERNERKLPVVELESLCSRVTDGTHQSPKWEQSGIPFLFISNIVDGTVTFKTDKFISRETYEELTRRCRIESGDVLYTTVGSYGNTAIVDGRREFCFQRHIAHIKPNPKLLDSVFCAVMLESRGVRWQVDRCARGVAQKTVNLSDLKSLKVFAPSLEVQREFRRKADAVRRLKGIHATAAWHDEALFQSIQHHAFRGEI